LGNTFESIAFEKSWNYQSQKIPVVIGEYSQTKAVSWQKFHENHS
jgi:folylpolyglutamate synthase/dihydropteroate synthase